MKKENDKVGTAIVVVVTIKPFYSFATELDIYHRMFWWN